MKNINNLSKYGPVVLRLGLVVVFVWFGCNQLLNPNMWVSLIPSWATSLTGMSAETFVTINATFELIMAVLLAFGIGVRIVTTLLFLHMFTIVSDVGLNPVGIRDLGLMFALLSIALQGPDMYSFDRTAQTNKL